MRSRPSRPLPQRNSINFIELCWRAQALTTLKCCSVSASRLLSILAAFVAVLAGGIWLGGHPENLPKPVRNLLVDDDRALRAELIDTIEGNFYRPVSDEKLREASLKGVVDSLDDQFSHYLTPKEASQFRESVKGEFEGVGMSVEEDRRGLRVLQVFDGSPADAGADQAERSDHGRERSLDRRCEQRGGHRSYQGP